MTKYLMFVVFGLLTCSAFSQDRIVRTSGDMIHCKITGVDSTKVYFEVKRGGNVLLTSAKRNSVAEMHYGVAPPISGPETDTLLIGGGVYHALYYCGGREIEKKEFTSLIKRNKRASELYQNSQVYGVYGGVFLIGGGCLIGYTIANSLQEGSVLWQGWLLGFGAVMFSVPLISKSNNYLQEAIDEYNRSLKPSSAFSNIDLDVGFSFGQTSLKLRF